MPVIKPSPVLSFARTACAVVLDLPDRPLVKPANITGSNYVGNVTLFLEADFWFPTADTNKVDRKRRMGQKATPKVVGQTTWDAPNIQYVWGPQQPPAATENTLMTAFATGSELYLLLRFGLVGEDVDFAAGQYVHPIHVRMDGPQVPDRTGEGEGDEFCFTQAVTLLEPPLPRALIQV